LCRSRPSRSESRGFDKLFGGMSRPPATEASPFPEQSPGIPNPESSWWRSWLACVAFYYPILWLSNSLVWSGPPLARLALAGERLEGLTLTPFGAVAATAPATGNGFASGTATSPFSLGITVALVLVVSLLLIVLGKRIRALGGLAIAALADVALAPWLRSPVSLRQMSFATVAGTVIFFAALCFGLRWMLSGWPAANFLRRLGNLLAGFVLLPVLPWLGFRLVRRFSLWPYALILIAPAALAAILASAPALWPHTARPQRAGWKTIACGFLGSLLLIAGVRAGETAIERARAAATRAAMAAYPKISVDAPYPKMFFQKGVSLSAESWSGYESESARRMLERLHACGVNAVALVPYGFAEQKRPEASINAQAASWESDEGLEEMSRVAHALGMKVMLKPGLWVSGGGFAGELDFPSPTDRARWFASYGLFLDHYARLATRIHADVFSIGGEFEKLTPYDAEWRALIRHAREVYPGPLVYAANWGGEFQSITFWDALDYIGLQDYYPLPDDLATGEVVRDVEAVQRKYQRPVIFTEVGFPSAPGANRKPWEDGRGAKVALELQARCYQAVFRAFYSKPWFEGMYWWKVGTNGFGGPDDTSLTPWGKPAMEVVRQWYTRPRR
jgi:Glycoside Hydrolase Family 113